ncbi:MAG: hypothetical protein ACYDHZ_00900 [Dehalococcoidia bacterium]
MDLNDKVKNIILSHVGRDNAITAERICELIYGVVPEDDPEKQPLARYSDRPVRLAIEDLIRAGTPICSMTEEPPGYFFPSSVEEAKAACKPLQRRAVMIFLRKRKIIHNTELYYNPTLL